MAQGLIFIFLLPPVPGNDAWATWEKQHVMSMQGYAKIAVPKFSSPAELALDSGAILQARPRPCSMTSDSDE